MIKIHGFSIQTFGNADIPEKSQILGSHDESEGLQGEFGVWLIRNGWGEEAVSRFMTRKPVRDYWKAQTIHDVLRSVPSIQGF